MTLSIQEAIFTGDNVRLKERIQALLAQSVSTFDTAGENFYHGFMLGLCALLSTLVQPRTESQAMEDTISS